MTFGNDYEPDKGVENAILVLAREMGRLADSIDHLSVASQALGTAPSGPPPGPPPPAGDSAQVKMGKKVYAICRTNEWDIPTVGAQVTGHIMDPNSQKWSIDDLKAVLDQFAAWGHP